MEVVSCLCIGDPHFTDKNIQEVEKLTEKILSLVKDKKPAFVVILGDILDTHEIIHEAPFNKAIFFLNKLSLLCPTFLLIGNHDYCNNSQFQTTRHAFNACKRWKNMFVVDKAMQKTFSGHNFFFCPYVPPGRLQECLETTGKDWKSATCIFAHQEFRGCKMGPIISSEGDEWRDEYPLVISGHIHDAQIVGKNVYYTGSVMQHSFGDNEKKGVWLVEYCKLFDKGWRYKKYDLETKKKKTVYLDASSESFPDLGKTEDDVRVVFRGTAAEFSALKKTKAFSQISACVKRVAFETKDEVLLSTTKKTYDEIMSELLEKEDDDVKNLWKKIRE